MEGMLHRTATVLPGNKVEIQLPELPVGQTVEVYLYTDERSHRIDSSDSLLCFLDSLPSGPRSSDSWERIEQLLDEERDAWNR